MNRLVIVSNRLPVTVKQVGGCYQAEASSGGLVTALRPIVQRHRSCWIGWTGTDRNPRVGELLAAGAGPDGCHLIPVFLSEQERHDFYSGFCNEILWPLLHDLQSKCNFEPAYWRSYVAINTRFSEVIRAETEAEDLVWIHDYHLMLQGKMLRDKVARERLVYFHHVPFPPPDVFEKLPWRLEILDSLLSFRTVGFQTSRDRRNFVESARRFFPEIRVRKTMSGLLVSRGEDATLVGAFPIGIDCDEFTNVATQQQVVMHAQQIRKNLKQCRIVLSVDRLDYTKGIPERLKAFRNLLNLYPGLHRHIALVQIVVPSREDIPDYQELKINVERRVGEINGHFGGPSWIPVHYLHRHLSRKDLVAYYRAADIAMITPLKDGMNLVAKEFCASRVDDTGILILSEFAGVANQLATGALLVNPYDSDKVALTLYNAMDMDEVQVRHNMRRMRRRLKTDDVHHWCEQVLCGTSLSAQLSTRSKELAPLVLTEPWKTPGPVPAAATAGELA